MQAHSNPFLLILDMGLSGNLILRARFSALSFWGAEANVLQFGGCLTPLAWPRVTITPPLLTIIQMASPRLSLVPGEITWKAVACFRDSREQAYGRVSVSRHLALEPSLSPSSSALVIARK